MNYIPHNYTHIKTQKQKKQQNKQKTKKQQNKQNKQKQKHTFFYKNTTQHNTTQHNTKLTSNWYFMKTHNKLSNKQAIKPTYHNKPTKQNNKTNVCVIVSTNTTHLTNTTSSY